MTQAQSQCFEECISSKIPINWIIWIVLSRGNHSRVMRIFRVRVWQRLFSRKRIQHTNCTNKHKSLAVATPNGRCQKSQQLAHYIRCIGYWLVPIYKMNWAKWIATELDFFPPLFDFCLLWFLDCKHQDIHVISLTEKYHKNISESN